MLYVYILYAHTIYISSYIHVVYTYVIHIYHTHLIYTYSVYTYNINMYYSHQRETRFFHARLVSTLISTEYYDNNTNFVQLIGHEFSVHHNILLLFP